MKLTQTELRRLIKEELGSNRHEQSRLLTEAIDLNVPKNQERIIKLLQQILMAIRAGPRQK